MKTGSLVIGLTCVAALHAPAQEPDKVEVYRGMLLKRPENAVLFGRLVDAWLAQGEMAGLKEMLETKAAGGGPMDWRLLAVFRNFSGDETGAIGALDEALKKAPDDAQTRLARAKALGAALRFEDALADLEVAGKVAEVAMEAGTLRGKFLARAGRPADAVKAWTEVIAAHPGDEGLREDLIELEIGEGMLEEAVAAARELAEKTDDPYQKALRGMRVAEILSQAGSKEEAVKEYGDVFAVSAEGSWLEREVLARVNALFSREDDAAGLQGFYDRLRETYPRRVVVKKEAALSLMASGAGDEAVAMFREVLKVLPGDRDARDEFIAMLEGAGRFKEAADEVTALLATADKDAALWEKLAAIRQSMDDQAGLKLAVDKAVSLVPEGEAGQISAAAVYERYNRLDDAEKTLRSAVKTHGISGEAGEALAVMLANRGKPDEAVAMWREMAETADREGLLRIARSLTAHGRAADAYGILSSRMAGFEGDPLLLAALCQAAQFSDQSETAIPQAIELVRMAKTTGDLETALRQAMAIVSRAEDPRKTLDQLAAKPDLSTQELCLLAEMHETLGDSIEADRIMKDALASGDPLMAAAQRVRLFELRGDLTAAIAATRDWLALPGGLRTEQVKRLVTLLERSGDNDAALKETENWKRIAPGDKLAWTKRAELFTTEGFPDEAVAELRRALAKFGSDEELRSKLAAALSEAGLFEESWRMSYALYDEAETPAAKLKWVGTLAEMAAREGREEELIADFKRRSRDNPSSVVPLLAMAEMYRTWYLTEEEAQVIEEASRRKPADVTLLHRLADLAEQTGSNDKAEALLQRAIRIEDSPENRRRLSSYWVRNGEAERGLAELLANGGASPRDTERLVLSLAASKDWDTAVRILAAECPRYPDDWRLAYLHAVALRETDAPDEAITRFAALLDSKVELPGVLPLIPPDQMKWLTVGDSGAVDFRLFARFRMLTDRSQNQRNRMYGMNQTGEPMPGTLLELRWMALCQALSITDENPETRDAKLATINSTELPDLDFIKSIHALDDDNLRERMLAADADPRLFRWYLDNFNYRENPYQNNQLDLKLVRRGVDRCLTADPELALILMARLPMDGDDALGPDLAGRMLEIIAALPGDKRATYLGALMTLSTAGDKLVSAETRKQAEVLLLAGLKTDDPKTDLSPTKYHLAVKWLRAGRTDDAAALLNEIYQAAKDPVGKAKGNFIMTPYGMMPYGAWQGQMQVAELKFPEVLSTSVHYMLQSQFSSGFNNGMQAPTPAHKKLLGLLGEKNTRYPGQAEPEPPVDPEILAELLPKLEDPVLRVFVAQCVGKPEPLAAEITALENAAEPDADALRIAAAYHLSVGDDPAKAYQLLVPAGRLATDRSRDALDWNLYQTGVALAAKSPEGVDLDPARRAALRLRKRMSADENMKRQLAAGMVKLGLDDESRRYTAAPKGLSANRSRYGGMQGGSVRRGSNEQVVAALVAQGKRDAAARRLLTDLRFLRANASLNSNSNYEERQLVERITSLKLEDEIAKIAQPPAGAGYKTRREYAMLLAGFKKQEAALPLLRVLAAEKPDDFEVRTALLLVLPKDEQRDFVLTLSAGEFDADRMGTWFSSAFESTRNGSKVEDFFSNIEMMVLFLEKLPPSFEPGRNLSWVNYLAKDVFNSESFGEVRLTSLRNPSEDSKGRDEARSKQRDALALRLYQAMLRHPQTSEQAFILMTSNGKALTISSEILDQAALTAFSQGLRLKPDPQDAYRYGGSRSNLLWMWRTTGGGGRSSGSPTGGQEPLTYLMRRAANGSGGDPFSPEFLAELEKDAPDMAKSVRQCLKIVETPGVEEFTHWKDGVKNEPERISEQLLTIARLAFFRNRMDILDACLDFAADSALGGSRGPYSIMPGAVEVFSLSVSAGKDLDSRTKAVKAITTRVLGPEEGWELYGDPNSGGQQLYPIQIRSSIYRQLGDSIRGDLPTAVAFARFAAERGIGPLAGIELRQAMNSSDFRSNVAGTVKDWIESGLLAPGPALASSADREGNSIIESLEQNVNNYGNSDSKKAMAEILLKTDGPERFWARLLGARLTNKPDAAIAELNANASAIAKWPTGSRNDLARIVSRWFPTAEKEASSNVRNLLAKSLKQGDAETRKLAEGYLKDGFPNDLQPYSVDNTMTGMMRRLIADDPELGAKVWSKLQEHLRTRQQGGWSSTRNGYRQTVTQYVNMQLMQSLDNNNGNLPVSRLVEFMILMEKESPEAASGLLDPDAMYYVRRLFDGVRSRGKEAFEKDKALKALEPDARRFAGFISSVARETEKDARPLLAGLLLADAANGNSWSSINEKSLPGLLDWVRKDLRKLDSDIADAALLMLVPRDEKKVREEDKPGMREVFRKFATDERIPAGLRFYVMSELVSRQASTWWSEDSACAAAVAALLAQAAADGPSWGSSDTTDFYLKCAALKDLTPADAAGVLSAIKGNLPDYSQYSSDSASFGLSRVMIAFAIRSGDSPEVTRLVKADVDTLRGNLAFAMQLWQADEDAAASTLIARPGEYHTGARMRLFSSGSSHEKLPLFSRESEAALSEWLETIEDPEQRYRVECLVSSARDAEGDSALEIKRPDRIKALVKRFAAECPKARVSRNEVLAALSVEFSAVDEIASEYSDAIGKEKMGLLLTLRDGNSRNGREEDASYNTEQLIRTAMRLDLEGRGDPSLLLEQMKSIGMGAVGNQRYRARELMNDLGPWYGSLLVRSLIDLPAAQRAVPAGQALEIAAILLEHGDDEVKRSAVGLAIASQAVAGDGAALDRWLAALPEDLRKTYDKIRSDRGLRGVLGALKRDPLSKPEHEKSRLALLTAIVSDPATVAREINLQSDLNALVECGVFSREEFFTVVDSVPEDHPKRVELLVEKAGVTGWALGKTDDAMMYYEDAKAAAGDDEMHLNYAKAHQIIYLDGCLHRYKDALEIAKGTGLTGLAQLERDAVVGILKRNTP